MSAIVPAVVFELHIARSKFVDAYNAADSAVRARLQAFSLPEKTTMGDNLASLLKVAAGPQYAKSAKKRIDALVLEIRDFQPLRCDVVHGRMSVMSIDGVVTAMFANVQKSSKIGRYGLMLTLDEIQRSTDRMNAIADELKKIKISVSIEPPATQG
ncbi:hypothetical protein GCM10011515_12210 [Tsuneonella deserti]|uniref:Uncharacterized protein n=1 Tax=Tsuneonella deserti TaxID=2035528 RepID=A0ABQ1S8G5_9SPHN|nr:hypothetical protein [Tsuneonella deserti]GGD93965.1 hypothetical protein GCM10011515_12210 [Tsuneonella deserti]